MSFLLTRGFAAFVVVLTLLTGCDDGGDANPMDTADAAPERRPCNYPMDLGVIGFDAVIPPLAWEGAIGLDGQPHRFSLEDFHCQPEYDEYNTLFMVIGAAWCNACPPYFEQIAARADELRAAGTLVMYMELQTLQHVLATSEQARDIIDGYITSEAWGLRVGDGDGVPEAGIIDQVVSRVPSGFMIRKSDMKIIFDRHLAEGAVDVVSIAENWETGWAPDLSDFESNCEEGDEEASEPNDTIDLAPTITPGEALEGGICAAGPDFYRVEIEGPWRAHLYQNIFAHGGVDDLELQVYNQRLERVRHSSARQNHETVEYEGPAYLAVVNYQNSSNSYRVEVEAL